MGWKNRLRHQRRKLNRKIKAEAKQDVTFAATSLEIQAAEDGSGAVDIVAYNGGLLKLGNFPHPAVIDLNGVQLHGNASTQPLLRDHDQGRPVGHGTPSINNINLLVQGTLSVPGEERDKIIQAKQNGFAWQASVGGSIPDSRKNIRVVAAGQKATVNGREFQGPIVIVKAFVWKETSFVALGADEDRATANVAAANNNSRRNPVNEFEKWLQAMGLDANELEDTQKTELRAAFDALEGNSSNNQQSQVATADVSELVASAVKEASVKAAADARDEITRLNRIGKIEAQYDGKTSLSTEKLAELKASADTGKISVETYELELLRASSRSQSNVSNVSFGSRRKESPLTLEAACFRNSGAFENDEEVAAALQSQGYAEEAVVKAMNEACSSRHDDTSISDVIHASCQEQGLQSSARIRDEDIEAAISHGFNYDNREGNTVNVYANSGGFSTVSLPGILGRLANKAMLAAYAEADNGGVATKIASTTSTNDFKKFNRYRMTEAGTAELIPAGGEIPHSEVSEEEFENQVKTYGRMISLTREMQVNDDLNAFIQLPRMMGRQARHALEQMTIETLVNATVNAGAGTTEFFHGAARDNKQPNYFEGASSALSMTSLETAYELFLNQTDDGGKPINIDPAMLLVTNGDIVLARKLYNDSEFRFTSADSKELINNQWQGMFEPVKSAYLHRLGSSPSSVHWFLLGSPSQDISAIQIAYLRGQRTPVISRGDVAFNRLGAQWRVLFDFGVALQDGRAIVKSKGAA